MTAVPPPVIADISRQLIAQIAPQELPIFRANSQAYFENPQKVLKQQSGKDDMLGFGIGEASMFLTPVALFIVSEVTAFLVKELRKSITVESGALIGELVKQLFKRFRSAETDTANNPPPLTTEQLAHVRALAYEKACQLRIPDTKASVLADAIAGSLVSVTT